MRAAFVLPLALALALALALGCGRASTPAAGDGGAPQDPGGKGDLYGSDDRQELYAAEATYRQVGRSTALVAQAWAFDFDGQGRLRLNGASWSDAVVRELGAPLCASEPYRTQPAPGICSAFLVAPDLVATAGHCVNMKTACGDLRFVFGFAYDHAPGEADVTVVPEEDFYRCATVVGHLYDADAWAAEEVASRELWSDWAVVRLDRPVTGRAPLPLRTVGAVAAGALLHAVGHPGGIPAKVTGGRATDVSHELYVNTDLDIYAGNSGSLVTGASGVAEGIVIRGTGGGHNSFVLDGTCYRSRHCAQYDLSLIHI